MTEPAPLGTLNSIIFASEALGAWDRGYKTSPRSVTHDKNGKRLLRHAYGRQDKSTGQVMFGGDREPCGLSSYDVGEGVVEQVSASDF